MSYSSVTPVQHIGKLNSNYWVMSKLRWIVKLRFEIVWEIKGHYIWIYRSNISNRMQLLLLVVCRNFLQDHIGRPITGLADGKLRWHSSSSNHSIHFTFLYWDSEKIQKYCQQNYVSNWLFIFVLFFILALIGNYWFVLKCVLAKISGT